MPLLYAVTTHRIENHQGQVAKQDDNGFSVDTNEISWQKCTVTMGSLLISLPVRPVESRGTSGVLRYFQPARTSQRKHYPFLLNCKTSNMAPLKTESPRGFKNSFPSLGKLKRDIKSNSCFLLIHHGFQLGLFSHHVISHLTMIPEMMTIQSSVLSKKLTLGPQRRGVTELNKPAVT